MSWGLCCRRQHFIRNLNCLNFPCSLVGLVMGWTASTSPDVNIYCWDKRFSSVALDVVRSSKLMLLFQRVPLSRTVLQSWISFAGNSWHSIITYVGSLDLMLKVYENNMCFLETGGRYLCLFLEIFSCHLQCPLTTLISTGYTIALCLYFELQLTWNDSNSSLGKL